MTVMSRWIRYVQEREIEEDTERQWQDKLGESSSNKTVISWSEYRKHVFGFIEEDKPETGYNFRQILCKVYCNVETGDQTHDGER